MHGSNIDDYPMSQEDARGPENFSNIQFLIWLTRDVAFGLRLHPRFGAISRNFPTTDVTSETRPNRERYIAEKRREPHLITRTCLNRNYKSYKKNHFLLKNPNTYAGHGEHTFPPRMDLGVDWSSREQLVGDSGVNEAGISYLGQNKIGCLYGWLIGEWVNVPIRWNDTDASICVSNR